jgi:DNA-binding response OmpR family regulator
MVSSCCSGCAAIRDATQLPFIILSAKADTADLRMGMSLGADDYVTKPFDPPDLTKTVAVRAGAGRRRWIRISTCGSAFLTSALPRGGLPHAPDRHHGLRGPAQAGGRGG